MTRNGYNRDMGYRNDNFGRGNNRSGMSLDEGRITMSNENDSYLDREFDLRGSDYGRTRDYERDFGESSRDYGWDKNFERSQRERNGNADRGWSDMDMRQNDFGTRRYSNDNFRETRWGSERPFNQGRHFGKGPKGWKRSDERIREEACEALYRDPGIDASEIEVSVREGTLTLTGTVDSRNTKRMAERCVEDIAGVVDVRNEIRIQPKESNHSRVTGQENQGKEAGSPLS